MKLQAKAQECVSRKKAKKILEKYEKTNIASHDPTRGYNSLV